MVRASPPASPCWTDDYSLRIRFFTVIDQALREAHVGWLEEQALRRDKRVWGWGQQDAGSFEDFVAGTVPRLIEVQWRQNPLDENRAPIDAEQLLGLIEFLVPYTKNFRALDELRGLALKGFLLPHGDPMPPGSNFEEPVTADIITAVRSEHLSVLEALLHQLTAQWNNTTNTQQSTKAFLAYTLGGNAFTYTQRARRASANLYYRSFVGISAIKNLEYTLRAHALRMAKLTEKIAAEDPHKEEIETLTYTLREIIWYQLEPSERAWAEATPKTLVTDYVDAIDQ